MNPFLHYQFDSLPKSRYWRRTSSLRHLNQFGLTPEVVMGTLTEPTDMVSQDDVTGRYQEFYRFYPPGTQDTKDLQDAEGGAWFRAVIDPQGQLYTAFRDHFTELQGGRECCPTPATTTNF